VVYFSGFFPNCEVSQDFLALVVQWKDTAGSKLGFLAGFFLDIIKFVGRNSQAAMGCVGDIIFFIVLSYCI
jgi:hypothetical protein